MAADGIITRTGDGIVECLDSEFGLQEVRTFPDDPRSYTLKSQHGALLVSYNGRRWSDPQGGQPRHITQIRYALQVMTKALNRRGGEAGAQNLLDDVASFMEGRLVEGFVFYPTRDDFIRFQSKDGTWLYGIEVTGYAQKRLSL